MTREKILLTDVDGTIVNFADPFHDWLAKAGVQSQNGGTLWDDFLICNMYDCTQEEARQHVLDFSSSPAFGTLPPLEGAQECLSSLRSDGWRIVAVTACHVSPEACAERRANLANLFDFPPEDILFSGLLGEKYTILKTFPSAYWVEDVMSHAIEGAVAGHIPILFDRPYNQEGDETISHVLKRVKSWGEIATYLGV